MWRDSTSEAEPRELTLQRERIGKEEGSLELRKDGRPNLGHEVVRLGWRRTLGANAGWHDEGLPEVRPAIDLEGRRRADSPNLVTSAARIARRVEILRPRGPLPVHGVPRRQLRQRLRPLTAGDDRSRRTPDR